MVRTMAEECALWRFVPRALVPVVGALAMFCAVALVAGPATASPLRSWAAPDGSLPVPGAFRLAASNGYTLYVIAEPPRGGRSGSVLIFASAKGRGANYVFPATVTETSMQADLGGLGEISLTFQRTNQPTSVACGKRTIRFDSGQYEGRFDFQGEEGYTSVEATSVPGNIDYFLAGSCGGGFFVTGTASRPQGAELYVRNPALGPRLRVHKRRPGAAAQIIAWTSEYSNGVSIERFADLRMPGGDFRYDRHLRTATLRPPPPFAGSARYDRGKKAGQRWSGDLTVDLPGSAGVPLIAPALRAYLVPSE